MNTANKITIFRIFLIPLFIIILMPQFRLSDSLAAIVFILASLSDTLDGYIARKYNQITDFGKFADPLADKLLVATALICLVDLGRISSYMAIIIIAREFIVTGLRVVAISNGVVMAAEMTGKIKTVIQLVAIILAILFYDPGIGLFGFSIGYIAMFIATLFTIYSGYVYLKHNWKLINTHK